MQDDRNEFEKESYWQRDDSFDKPAHGTSTSSYIFAGFGLLLGLVLVAALIGGANNFFGGQPRTVAQHQDVLARHAAAQRMFDAYDAAGSHWLSLPPEDQTLRSELEALFTRIAKGVSEDNKAAVTAEIDFDRLVMRIDNTGGLADWNSLEKQTLGDSLSERLDLELYWHRLQLIGIETPADDPHSRVAYVLGWDASDEEAQYVVWVARDGDSWKAYDWERLDLGMTESETWGVNIQYMDTTTIAGYRAWSAGVERASSLFDEGQQEEAIAELHAAEKHRGPSELQDMRTLITAYYWRIFDESDEANRCANSLSNLDAYPGGYWLLAQTHRWDDPEKALDYVEKFEACIGAHPDILQLHASLLSRLDREEEAAECYRRILEFTPDNESALTSYFWNLPDERKGEVEALLTAQENRDQLLRSLVTSAKEDDPAGFRWLTEYLQRVAPDSAAAKSALAAEKESAADFAGAAELYREALRVVPADKSGEMLSAYLSVSLADGRIVQAVRDALDKEQAIETVLYWQEEAEYEITADEHRQIVNMYAEQFPDEPASGAYLADLQFDDGDYQAAAATARRVLTNLNRPDNDATDESTDEEDEEYDESDYYKGWVEGTLSRSLYKLGKVQEAYEVGDDREERFSILVSQLLNNENWTQLQQLVELHAQRFANSQELRVAQATLAAHQGDWDRASRTTAQVLTSITEDEPRAYGKTLRCRGLFLDAGRWEQYYQLVPDKKEEFRAISRYLIAAQAWDAARKLHDMYRQRYPRDVELYVQDADLAWETGDDVQFLRKARAALENRAADGLPRYTRLELEERMVMALIRTGSAERIEPLIDSLFDSESADEYRAIVAAARRQFAVAERFARTALDGPAWSGTFYNHQLLGSDFLAEPFAELHRDFPVDVSSHSSRVEAVLFSAQPATLEAVQIGKMAREFHPSCKVSTLRPKAPHVSQCVLIECGESCVWLATGQAPFHPDWKVADNKPEFVGKLAQGKHWLAIGTTTWSEPGRDTLAPLVREIARQLTASDCVAIAVAHPDYWKGMILCDTGAAELTRWLETGVFESRGQPVDQNSQASVALEEVYPATTIEERRRFTKSLRQAIAAWQKSPDKPLIVLYSLTGRTMCEPVPIRVTDAKYSYGSYSLTGEIRAASRLLPELRAGLPVAIDDLEVSGWQRGENSDVCWEEVGF